MEQLVGRSGSGKRLVGCGERGGREKERGKNETNGEKFHYIFQHVKIKIF